MRLLLALDAPKTWVGILSFESSLRSAPVVLCLHPSNLIASSWSAYLPQPLVILDNLNGHPHRSTGAVHCVSAMNHHCSLTALCAFVSTLLTAENTCP